MTFDRDYTACIIPVAEVRSSGGRPYGQRGDANVKKSRSRCYTVVNRLSSQFRLIA